MKSAMIAIVDHGRGPQLASKRITVQDFLPFYREGASAEDIRRWVPALTDDEIGALTEYIRDHFEEVVDAEKAIKEYHDRMRAAQPAWTRANDHLSLEERRAILQAKLAQRLAEKNGADDSLG